MRLDIVVMVICIMDFLIVTLTGILYHARLQYQCDIYSSSGVKF